MNLVYLTKAYAKVSNVGTVMKRQGIIGEVHLVPFGFFDNVVLIEILLIYVVNLRTVVCILDFKN